MNGKFLLRFSVLLVLLAFTMYGAEIMPTILTANYTTVGFAQGHVSTYYDFNNLPHRSGAQMEQVGGNITLDGTLTGAVGAATVESFMHAAPGALTTLMTPYFDTVGIGSVLGTPTVGTGSAIQFTGVTAAANDVISFLLSFVSNDYSWFNDFAFYAIGQGTAAPVLGLLAVTTDPNGVANPTVMVAGENGWTDWGKYSLPALAAAGTYTVTLGVMNVGDGLTWDGTPLTPLNSELNDSALLLQGTPEPSTWLLAGSSLLGAALLKLRKRAR